MNKKVRALTKVFLKHSFQNFETAKTTNQKAQAKGMMLFYIIIFAYLAGIVGFFSYNLIDGLLEVQQEQIFLGIILLGIALFILIQTIFSAMSLLYYSKDNEYILPLPINPSQILMGKTNVLLLTEYFIELIIGLIPLTIYGIMTGAGAIYYFAMALVLIFFPIIPILISSLLVLLVMSFAKYTKNRNRFQLIATVFIIFLVMGISYGMSGMQGTEEEMIQMLTQANGLVQTIQGGFPTLRFAINALASDSIGTILINLGILIAVTVILYVVYILIGQKLYLKGAVGNLAGGKKTSKKLNEAKAFRKSSLARTYVGKELKTLIRNPIFFMQCVLPAILFPILVIVLVFAGMKTEEGTQITDLSSMIGDKTSAFIGVGILAAIQFFSMFIYISATAISREGQNAVFMKYIPVPYRKQIEYKVMPNIIMMVIMDLITMVMIQYLFRLPIGYLLMITIVAIIMGIFQSYLLIIVDMKKPKLEWNSEYAVVKQNLNLIWPVVLSVVNISILIGTSLILESWINSYLLMGLYAIFYLLVTFLLKRYLDKNAVKLLEKIY